MSQPAQPKPNPSAPEARLDALVRRARLTLLWERLWPPLASAGAVVALFFAASWAGLWFYLPLPVRLAALALFALGLGWALFPVHKLRWPSASAARARLDRDAPGRHNPASAFADRLGDEMPTPETRALWTLHRARLAREVEALEVAPPAPGLMKLDPRALRFAAVLVAVAAFLAAGPERYARFRSAFDFRGIAASAGSARIDAWIDPPAYANKPPILLPLADGEPRGQAAAPQDSVIVLRAESVEVEGAVEGAIVPIEAKAKPTSGVERRFAIHGDGALRVLRDGSTMKTFDIQALTAAAPTIALVEPPKPNVSGSLTLHYRVAGGYPVTGAEGAFDVPGQASKHRLAEPPKFALQAPSGGAGEATATVDLSESPWAGAEGALTLSATDAAGKTGRSEATKFALPQRVFNNPLARALVEQRRKLALDPDGNKAKLAQVLAALRLAPEAFGTTPGVYLGLREAALRLDRARDDKALNEVADLLWAMAQQIEDGDSPRTLRELRAAQQKLREALKNGASDADIAKLTKELRELAERYLLEMAKSAEKANPEDEPLDAQDLDSMLDRLEDSARNGARSDAEAMLDQLQNLFENMRGARSAQQSQAEREMRQQMNELDKLLRDQQALRDDTFKRNQRDKSRGETDNDPSLAERQQALKDKLEELEKRMKGLGLEGEQGFGDAQGDMKEAEGDLQPDGEGKGPAVDAQGRALDHLRKGMQGLQKQMQAGAGGSGYRAVGRQPGSPRDPLGRNPRGNRGAEEGTLNDGPEAAARARRVLQELRRRLADPNRPGEERDYLERLLKPE